MTIVEDVTSDAAAQQQQPDQKPDPSTFDRQDETSGDVKPDQISIKVLDSTGGETVFRLRMSTKLSKLKKTYAERLRKNASSLRFLYDGSRITDEDTPTSLGMEDNDTIEVMTEQIGGTCNS